MYNTQCQKVRIILSPHNGEDLKVPSIVPDQNDASRVKLTHAMLDIKLQPFFQIKLHIIEHSITQIYAKNYVI